MKTDRLTIRMDPQVKAEARRLAAAEGRSLSNWLEMLIMKEAGKAVAAGD